MANKKPASVETVNRLISDMHLTLVSSYKELIADLRMAEVLKRNDLHGLDAAEKEYIGNVLSVHANVCYCNLCLCAQMRASLKAKLDVEKQFTIRRGVGTLHEMYKYLFGFTPKKTLWQEVEDVLRSKYPVECQAVDDAATSFLQQYAQVEDGTLRDVTKHFSDDPTEFFQNMKNVTERSVTERVAAGSAFLLPLHQMLVKELREYFGTSYDLAITFPMPEQNIDISGVNQEKIEAIGQGLVKYSGIVNHLMLQLDRVQELCKKFNLDVMQNQHWKDFTQNNIGLHILYIYIDSMSTFRAFVGSESFAEIRQNLAYFILSAHEGFKKLYGFDENKRDLTYWNRAIKTAIMQNGDDEAKKKAVKLEMRLDDLSQNALLKNEDMIVAFTHVGTIKKRGNVSAFLVLDYFRQPINRDEMNQLTEFLGVMNDIVALYNQVMDLENRQIQQETDNMFAGYFDQLDGWEEKMKEKAQGNLEAIAKCEELMNLMRNGLNDIKKKFS